MTNVLSIINGIRDSFVYIIGGSTLVVLLLAAVILVKNILNRQRSSFVVLPDLYPQEDKRQSIAFSADDIVEISDKIPPELKEISSKQSWDFFEDFIALDGTSPELEELIHADIDFDRGLYAGAQEAIADVNISDYQYDYQNNYSYQDDYNYQYDYDSQNSYDTQDNYDYQDSYNYQDDYDSQDSYHDEHYDSEEQLENPDVSNDYAESQKLEHMIDNVSNDPWEESEYDNDYDSYVEPLENNVQDDTWSNMLYGTTVEVDEQIKILDELPLDSTVASTKNNNGSFLSSLDLVEREHSSSNNELYESFGFDVQSEEGDDIG